MAVITTGVVELAHAPLGRFTLKTFRVPVVTAGAADEWIRTGLTTIVAIIGLAPIGTALVTNVATFRKNANGTGQAEGSTHGSLAIESDASITYEVTVLGT